MAVTITPSQLKVLLAAAIAGNDNVLITGAPGIGKSSIVEQAAQAAGADLIISHPAVADPTDFKGLPWPGKNKDEATFLPFGELARALKATKKTVWFLDDLGQATPAVQAAAMQLLLARRVNGHVLPDSVTFIAATNRRVDRAGVTGILEPVKSRFRTIVELVASLSDYSTWALANDINPMQVAFLRYREELLSKFEASADLTNSPMPRTWEACDKIEKRNLPQAIEAIAMAGSVGEKAAGEYLAFRQMANSIVSIDAILASPKTAKIPTKPNELYATCMALARRANDQTFARIVQYAERMATEGPVEQRRGEFACLLMRDIVRFDAEAGGLLQHSDTFVKMSCGPVGQLMNGNI